MIDSTKLKYKKFIDPRNKTVDGFKEGFSGELLLGTDSYGNRYIIKYTEVMDINEFRPMRGNRKTVCIGLSYDLYRHPKTYTRGVSIIL